MPILSSLGLFRLNLKIPFKILSKGKQFKKKKDWVRNFLLLQKIMPLKYLGYASGNAPAIFKFSLSSGLSVIKIFDQNFS